MSEVKILLEGYAKERDGGWRAHSTSVLIRDSGLNSTGHLLDSGREIVFDRAR